MTIVHKRLLYLIFFAVFLIAGPLITLYASGYRYNFKKHLLQKTGAINLESYPEKVQVYLDGELLKSETPTQIRNLLPREYEVQVAKEGYIPWKKNVLVNPNATTFLPNIELFREPQLPEFISELPPNVSSKATSTDTTLANHKLFLSESDDQYVLISEDQLFKGRRELARLPMSDYEFHESINDWVVIRDSLNDILYLLRVKDDEITQRQLVSPVNDFAWSLDGRELLYFNNFELWLINPDSGAKKLITRLGSGIDGAALHPGGKYAYYLSDNQVKIIELRNTQQRLNFVYAGLPTTTQILIGESGQYLYLKGQAGSQKGWFEMRVQ